VLVFTGYKIYEHFSNRGFIEEVDQKEIEVRYRQQNDAFYGWGGTTSFVPYDKEFEWITQVHICFYMRYTGKTITVRDVEAFLATSEKPNGTPRTWKDDETGIIYDFVEWVFYQGKGIYEFNFYRDKLLVTLTHYCDEHRDCPYRILSDLTPEQIIELDKKYVDPDYNLVLVW
jgi:hypothetical protein